jgi:hypothetical protein
MMLAPLNVSSIDSNYLELKIQDSKLINHKNINLTWSTTSLKGRQLQLQLNFSDPLEVSAYVIYF